jgi:hypothetical protein
MSGTDGGRAAQVEGISDRDLADGAGQVILEFIKSNFGEFDQTEILDIKDLRRAVGAAQLMVDADSRLEQCMRCIIGVLHLLETGYYRSLLLEERNRVGKIDYRFEAMMKFKDMIQKAVIDRPGSSLWPPTLASSGLISSGRPREL